MLSYLHCQENNKNKQYHLQDRSCGTPTSVKILRIQCAEIVELYVFDLSIVGGLKHWEATSESSLTQHNIWMPPYQQSRSVNIETTSYALLIYATQRDISRGLPIAKWLIKQRNALGGFSSTQMKWEFEGSVLSHLYLHF